MKTFKMTAAKAIATLAIVSFGVTATTLADGATASHHTSTARVAHASSGTCKAIKNSKPAAQNCTFDASYSGTISILWNTSGPSTASITGKGKGTDFGFTGISGSGTSVATAQSDPINGSGVLSGKGETLKVKLATGSTATAVGSAAPTVVTVSGSATVVKGTGTFANASGTLKVSGEFSIKNTSGSEKDSFSATLKGVVKIKK